MKLKQAFRAFLTLGLAIAAVNLTAPTSQADSQPPMGLYVLPGDNNDITIITTHFEENKLNLSTFNEGELRESNNFQTGESPIALTFDFTSGAYSANIGDSSVTRIYDDGSGQLRSCSVATGPDDFSGVNPIAITAVPGGVVTGNIGDNTVSSLQFNNACQLLSRTVVPTPNRGDAPTPGRGPVAFYTSYNDAESIVLNSQAKTLQNFDGEQFLYDPYDADLSDVFWNSSLELEEEVFAEDFYPVGFTTFYGDIFILFDEYLHGTQTSIRQHLLRLPYNSYDFEYLAGFNSPGWTVPNSQRLVLIQDALCLITSSSVITCWRGWNNPNLTIDMGRPGLAAIATDFNGNLYAANSLDKTVTRFNSDGSVDHVFQISLTQPSLNSNQGNSVSAPSSPTSIVAKTTGKRAATVSFAPPASTGGSAVTYYSATSSPGGITKTLTQSSGGIFTFDNLQPGTTYTFAVTATNAIGTSVATTSNSIKTMPLEVASISSLSFVDDGTGTGGKIVWFGNSIDSVLYTGPVNSYPGPYNYGAFSSGWNGRIRNLEPDKIYTISIFAVSADGVGETKSLTFRTNASLPILAGSANSISTSTSSAQSTSTKLAPVLKWVEENTFVTGEAANMSNLLVKFDALETSAHRTYIKVPTSRVSNVDVKSLTPKACSVVSSTAKVDAGLVTALNGDKCTISYTVTGSSKAPATLVKDFIFQNYVR